MEVTAAAQRSEHPYALGYHPALDGLRGIAIVLVVAVHALMPDVRAAASGASFVGVNLFFVLSGFLITSILIAERERKGSINLKRFYVRRALRLGPGLLLMLAVFVAGSWALGTAREAATNSQDSLLALFYIANWTRALGWERPGLFGHTWSLSIEEQFYVLWPLILVWLLKRRVAVPSLLRGLALGVFLLAVYRLLLVTAGAASDRVFNGTDTRGDALLIGCLLGVAYAYGSFPLSPAWRRVYGMTGWLSIAVLALLCCRRDFHAPFVQAWLYTVVNVSAAGVLLAAMIGEAPWLKMALETRPLVYVGKISYGLYLWHAPVFQIWLVPDASLRSVFLALLISIGATLISYYAVERPALRFKALFSSMTPERRITSGSPSARYRKATRDGPKNPSPTPLPARPTRLAG